jgi:serine/threonine-protein kinase
VAPSEPAIEAAHDRHRHHAPVTDAPSAGTGPGTVTIATPGGWAVVYEGRERLGDAPGTFSLPAGPHTLDVQPFGRGDRSHHRVQVGAGATARVVVPVTP